MPLVWVKVITLLFMRALTRVLSASDGLAARGQTASRRHRAARLSVSRAYKLHPFLRAEFRHHRRGTHSDLPQGTRSNQRGRNRRIRAGLTSTFLSRAPGDPAGQSGPSRAREIAWPILSAASTISRSPTWAYFKVIRASL